jgi:hypothetical protein
MFSAGNASAACSGTTTAMRHKAAPPFMLAPSPSQDHSALLWHYCQAFSVGAASRITLSQIRPRTQSCWRRIMLISKNRTFVRVF